MCIARRVIERYRQQSARLTSHSSPFITPASRLSANQTTPGSLRRHTSLSPLPVPAAAAAAAASFSLTKPAADSRRSAAGQRPMRLRNAGFESFNEVYLPSPGWSSKLDSSLLSVARQAASASSGTSCGQVQVKAASSASHAAEEDRSISHQTLAAESTPQSSKRPSRWFARKEEFRRDRNADGGAEAAASCNKGGCARSTRHCRKPHAGAN